MIHTLLPFYGRAKLLPTLLNAHEHARRFVLRPNVSTPTESAVASALEAMAIVAIDDHDIYSGHMLCRLVTDALAHPSAADPPLASGGSTCIQRLFSDGG